MIFILKTIDRKQIFIVIGQVWLTGWLTWSGKTKQSTKMAVVGRY